MFSVYNIDTEKFTFTLVEHLLRKQNTSDKQIAKRLTECEFHPEINYHEYKDIEEQGFCIEVPEQSFKFLNNKKMRLKDAIDYILNVNLDFIVFKIKHIDAPENWRSYTLKAGVNNQTAFPSTNYPLVSRIFDKSRNKGRHFSIKFRSPAEEALFENLYDSGCLFFPCPLGVSSSFNDPYYKEPDYLICKNGKWAILEVVADSTHSSVVSEAKRTRQFQNHNIPIRQYDFSQCIHNPKFVVDDFLNWLTTNI
jgi:hypothetical protein